VSERTVRRGMSGRVITTLELDDPKNAVHAATTGPEAWLADVEAMATDVLCDAGLIERAQHNFRTLRSLPDDRTDLSACGRAVRVLRYVDIARRAMRGSNVATAFEWGAKLMEAATMLDLELKGWPLAAERGHRHKLGDEK
jgi:hypothetical protein